MKTILHTNTLMHFDGIVLFEARDPLGGHYIASHIDEADELDRYAVVGVSPDSLRSFRIGVLDLRSLMLEMPDGQWYISRPTAGVDTPIQLEPQTGRLEDTNYLPEPGLILYDDFIDDLALLEARSRRNTVLEFSAEPPEAADDHRMRVETLVGLLTRIQDIVKYSYQSALQDRSTKSSAAPDGYLMDVVVPAAPGSFRVILEAAKRGDDDLLSGLHRMDEVFESAMYPDEAPERLRPHEGCLAETYIDLLNFLAEKNTGLRYSWADPSLSHSYHGGVSGGDAKRIAMQQLQPQPASDAAAAVPGE